MLKDYLAGELTRRRSGRLRRALALPVRRQSASELNRNPLRLQDQPEEKGAFNGKLE